MGRLLVVMLPLLQQQPRMAPRRARTPRVCPASCPAVGGIGDGIGDGTYGGTKASFAELRTSLDGAAKVSLSI